MKFIYVLRFAVLALVIIVHEASAATIGLDGSPENYDLLGQAVAAGNFNCDAFDDLAAGVPLEDVSGVSNAGVINIVYGGTGSGGQLGASGNHYVQTEGTPVENDQFGYLLATGDFNGDNCDDLVVGMPKKTVSGQSAAGQVMILYGHTNGPGYAVRQTWHQNTSGVHGGPEENDQFGSSFAAGDFNGDGRDDLAIGVEGENTYGGGVHVLHGQSSGLTALGSLYLDQNVSGVADARESIDHFGGALAGGDFNDDGYEDLAVGVHGETLNGIIEGGAVHVFYGSTGSLSGSGSQMWHQDVSGIVGTMGTGDSFGHSLEAGDFNGDGRDDLAIGVVEDHEVSPGFSYDSGAVQVLYGGAAGLTATGNQLWRADDPAMQIDVLGSNFSDDLAAGDFNADNRDDLAIGATGNDQIGAVLILHGSATGLTASGSRLIHQDVANVDSTGALNEWFGSSLAVGDFNNNSIVDLAVGVPGEITGNNITAGGVQVFYGLWIDGLDLSNDQLFVQ